MRSIEVKGKTTKEAINNGLAELGCDASEVDIQILDMGSPGLLGMFGRPAKVRLTTKDNDKDLDIEMPVISLDGGKKPGHGESKKQEKPKAEKPKAEKPAPQPREEEAAPAEEPRPEKKSRRSRKENKREAVQEPAQEEAAEPAPIEDAPFVATPEEELTDETRKARDFLKGLTERMGVPIEVETSQSAEQLRFQMSGENMSILIGRRGETLDAIQYLTSLTVNKGRDEYLRVSIDTENYRAKREEALRKLAVRMASRAKKTGKRVALEPMNPYERRILHSALQGDPAVTTHSEGEEPYRRVIITLK